MIERLNCCLHTLHGAHNCRKKILLGWSFKTSLNHKLEQFDIWWVFSFGQYQLPCLWLFLQKPGHISRFHSKVVICKWSCYLYKCMGENMVTFLSKKYPEQHLVKCRGKILECFQFKCWQQIGKSTFHWQLSLFTLFFLQWVFEANGPRVFFEGYALWNHLLEAFVISIVFYLNFFGPKTV